MQSKRLPAVILSVAALVGLTAAMPASPGGVRTYEVTIANLTEGQPLTPALVTTHRGSDGLFEVGSEADFELKEIAENGNLAPMIQRVSSDRDFYDLVVAQGSTLPPVLPGEMVSFEITATPGFNFLSWASMLICTNDGFTGIDTVKLPAQVGQSFTLSTQGYDAGTEMNTELFADMVPPCGPLTGQDSGGQGAGASDAELAENGVIFHHAGIVGVGDLDPSINDWTDPVAVVTVERTG